MVASELDKLEVTAITDAYQALKIVLQRKYGPNSELFEAIEQLERKPKSRSRMELLERKVVSIPTDADIVAAV